MIFYDDKNDTNVREYLAILNQTAEIFYNYFYNLLNIFFSINIYFLLAIVMVLV